MFITFRQAHTQTLVFNADAFRQVYLMTQEGYKWLDMEITDTQVLFKFNKDEKGSWLFKRKEIWRMDEVRKAIHTPDWIKPLVMAKVPFGRMYVRFDADNKMFVYENVDKQFSMEIGEAQKESRHVGTGVVGMGNAVQYISEATAHVEPVKTQMSSMYGEFGPNGGSPRTINRAMRRKLAKQNRKKGNK
jgi:hypothetical protein